MALLLLDKPSTGDDRSLDRCRIPLSKMQSKKSMARSMYSGNFYVRSNFHLYFTSKRRIPTSYNHYLPCRICVRYLLFIPFLKSNRIKKSINNIKKGAILYMWIAPFYCYILLNYVADQIIII